MKKRNDESLAVPMSQMIDVVFLLLIYFVVTMKDEISEAHLAINLPSAGAAPAPSPVPRSAACQIGRESCRERV